MPTPSETFPLSEGQKSLWFMHQSLRNSSAYHVALAVRIRSSLDAGALHRALQTLLDRHASLRTVFCLGDNNELFQRVFDCQTVAFEQTGIADWTEEQLEQEVSAVYKRPFDLSKGPLFRAHLFSDSQARHVLLLTVHHIVFDGSSMFTILTELQQLYGGSAKLRPLKHSYREFVEWQSELLAGNDGKSDLEYWRKQIENAPHILDFPTDHPRPAHFSGRGGSVVFELKEELAGRLRQLAQDKGVHLFDVFVAAYHVLLHRYSGQNDILLGFVTARSRSGIPATMIRAMMVASNRKSREVEMDADFYLRPPIDRFRLDDMARVEEIAEVGYQYTKSEIRRWREEGRLPGGCGS